MVQKSILLENKVASTSASARSRKRAILITAGSSDYNVFIQMVCSITKKLKNNVKMTNTK